DKNLESRLEKWRQVPCFHGQIPFTVLSSAGSYLDWILMGMKDGGKILLEEIPAGSILGREMAVQTEKVRLKESLDSFDDDREYDARYRKELESVFQYRYPYMEDITLYAKMTVSELKQQ